VSSRHSITTAVHLVSPDSESFARHSASPNIETVSCAFCFKFSPKLQTTSKRHSKLYPARHSKFNSEPPAFHLGPTRSKFQSENPLLNLWPTYLNSKIRNFGSKFSVGGSCKQFRLSSLSFATPSFNSPSSSSAPPHLLRPYSHTQTQAQLNSTLHSFRLRHDWKPPCLALLCCPALPPPSSLLFCLCPHLETSSHIRNPRPTKSETHDHLWIWSVARTIIIIVTSSPAISLPTVLFSKYLFKSRGGVLGQIRVKGSKYFGNIFINEFLIPIRTI